MQNRWQLLLWPCDWCWKTNNSKIANCDLVTDSMIQIIVRVEVGKKWFVILSYDRHPFGPRLVAVKLYHKSITVWVQEMQRSFPCLNLDSNQRFSHKYNNSKANPDTRSISARKCHQEFFLFRQDRLQEQVWQIILTPFVDEILSDRCADKNKNYHIISENSSNCDGQLRSQVVYIDLKRKTISVNSWKFLVEPQPYNEWERVLSCSQR